jgi:hypothetical protein
VADSKAFASLSPRLLARKGSARPAMRPQVAPLTDFPSATPYPIHEDLGWNDMGEASEAPVQPARVVPISGKDHGSPATPEVLVRRKMLARTLAESEGRPVVAKGKRAAFTLRIDPERHFKLRLACSVTQRSAQQLLTEALDMMLDQVPEIQPMASKSGKRR